MKTNVPIVPHEIVMNMAFDNLSRVYKDHSGNFVAMDSFYITRPVNIFVFPNGLFIEYLDKLMLECHQHGLLVPKSYPSAEKLTEEPKVLTMHMLEAGFVIWLCSVCVACVIFIIEQIMI